MIAGLRQFRASGRDGIMEGHRGKGHQVLLIDDDREFCELMADYLDVHSFSVSSVHTGTAGIEAARQTTYDIILLDMLLPDISGIEVLRHLRMETRTPVVILSAHNEETDRIVTLELGADDYVPKSFSARELLARIRVVLRRVENTEPLENLDRPDGMLCIRGLCMNPHTMKVTLNNVPLELTSMEFRLLYHLARGAGRIFSRENLLTLFMEKEWNKFDRCVDVHVSSLRKKLGDSSRCPIFLKTVRGLGYMFIKQSDS